MKRTEEANCHGNPLLGIVIGVPRAIVHVSFESNSWLIVNPLVNESKNSTNSFINSFFFQIGASQFLMYKVYKLTLVERYIPSARMHPPKHTWLSISLHFSSLRHTIVGGERAGESEEPSRESRVIVRLLGVLLRYRLERGRVGRLARADDGLGGHLHPGLEIPHLHSHFFLGLIRLVAIYKSSGK
ncbi:hypothetical protein EUGRSUZ_K03246 [Eucalyptus grandis]|uniref:Uncharacterized protein n=2 Tax=Eucalyptus grandis TaxID=71139 RepID=A0ACC3J0I0_EUCGR|nr:hypothetical protein EUGRSUZ_K03246 [Eucalyptus grandis]